MARVTSTIDETEVDSPDSKPTEETEKPSTSSAPSKIGFFQQLSAYTPAEWESLMVYVYRTSPITDRRATGNPTTYVMKYVGPFDEDRLKLDAGSGGYQLRLNQSNARGNSKTIKTYLCDIEDMKFPPKVPDGEWIDDPRNKRWEWARKKPEEAAAAAAHTPEVWSPERVMNMVERLRPQEKKEDQVSITREVLNAVKETRAELGKGADPAAMIGMLKDLILLTKPTSAEKPSEESGLVKLLMAQLEASREDSKIARASGEAERQRNHELQLKMMESKATAADPMDMVEKVLNLQKKLGGGVEEQRNWKEKLVDQGLEYVPQILDLAGKAITSYQRGPIAPRPPQQPAPQPPQQQQPAQPPASQSTPQPTTQEPTMPQQPPVDPDIAFLLPVFEAQGRLFVAAFKKDPLSGRDVARTVILFADMATYERIARMGIEKIMATIELLPEMKTDLLKAGSPEMLIEFIEDFIAGPEDPDEDEDEEREDGDDNPEPGFVDPIEDATKPLPGIPVRPKQKKKVSV